ncbi:MAG TPA: STAS domain-containing protein [Gaiellaceae bacterium]|nr:STAS domain-containing protein [Gaiellaceae bacterium]
MSHATEREPTVRTELPDQRPFLEFAVDVERLPDSTRVVTVVGDLDLHTAPEFDRHLLGATKNGTTSLIVDLARCGFVDSTALGILIAANRRLFATGRSLTVVTDDRNLRKVFEVTGLDRVFRIFPSRDDALNGRMPA